MFCIGQGVRPSGLKEYAKFAEKSLAVQLWLQRKGTHIEIIETCQMVFLMHHGNHGNPTLCTLFLGTTSKSLLSVHGAMKGLHLQQFAVGQTNHTRWMPG